MANLDPAVRKETGYISIWVLLLSLLMEAVFLLLHRWNISVLGGNLAGALVAIGNFFLLGWTVSKAVEQGKPEEAAKRVKASASFRMLGMAIICVIFIGVLKTDPYATLIPLLFPRIGLLFRPAIDKKRGVEPADTEGSDLID